MNIKKRGKENLTKQFVKAQIDKQTRGMNKEQNKIGHDHDHLSFWPRNAEKVDASVTQGHNAVSYEEEDIVDDHKFG